jgi:hypothetical protein
MKTEEQLIYQERRAGGKRGQGDYPILEQEFDDKDGVYETNSKLGGNRATRRRRWADRLYTKKGYRRGIKIGKSRKAKAHQTKAAT